MWKRTVRCAPEGEGGGSRGTEAAYGDADRTDRLPRCGEQGTGGAGTVLAQRGQALLPG